MEENRICNKCGEEKPISEYHKSKHCKNGRRPTCRDCRSIESKEYRSRDYVKNRERENYKLNRIKFKQSNLNYRWSLKGQYSEYKTKAKRRGYVFKLPIEYCEQYYNTNCHYCGDKYRGLGMDRVDNDCGYEMGNIVACCGVCNIMKRAQTQNDFLVKISKIYNKHFN